MEKNGKPISKYCIVPMCKNTTKNAPDKVFFNVPRDANIRKRWCKAMRRDDVSPKSCLHCCEDHFNIEEDTENYTRYKIMALQEGKKMSLRLKKGVVPHVFNCQKNDKPLPERKGAVKRKIKALVVEALSDQCVTNVEDSEADPCISSPKKVLQVDKAIQVNSKAHYRSKGISVNISVKQNSVPLSPFPIPCKNISTSPFKSAQSSAIKRTLFLDNPVDVPTTNVNSPSSISSDYEPNGSSSESDCIIEDESYSDEQFKNVMRRSTIVAIEREPKMLLGLPKRSFYLIKLLSENIPLPTIDILITLKKIKLNESFSILALQFGYTQSTISRIFSKSILTIAEKMKELIVWPAPSEIFKKLPISFRARYANVVSIIDCLEIEIQKPSDAVHQSLSWSQYKKCNTLKYLISCTPDGLVNYISDGYGGRATDVMIVEDCGFLDYLPPNKAVMADRGFKDLSRLLENKNCTLVRPPSVFKDTPSTKEDVKQSKRIAALRIHVERVISRLREFHMLRPHVCLDHNLIPVLDEIIVVACGLINIQDVLIKK